MCTASIRPETQQARRAPGRRTPVHAKSGPGVSAIRWPSFLQRRLQRSVRGAAIAILLAVASWPSAILAASQSKAPPVPIDITADHGQFNNATGVATYTGHVVLVRAKLTLTGNHLVIRRRSQTAPITAVLTGDPAHLRQGVTRQIKQIVRGTAKKITYSGQAGTVQLEDHAVVHHGRDLLQADEVTYNLNSGEITANTSKTSHGRVHMILHPQRRQNSRGGGS